MKLTQNSIKDITLLQPARGYRFSVDALLLEHFISAKRLSRGIELGTGSGVVSILLAKRMKHARIVGVEIQESLVQCARQNVTLNKLNGRIEILNRDINDLKKIFSSNTFDCVFSNPPFRKVKTGLLSVDRERAAARHEINITLKSLIHTASYLLKNTGKFYMIYHPFRLMDLMDMLLHARLEPKRLQFVHSRRGDEAKMVLLEAVKGSRRWLTVEPPFYIYEKGSEYTPEMKKIYHQ